MKVLFFTFLLKPQGCLSKKFGREFNSLVVRFLNDIHVIGVAIFSFFQGSIDRNIIGKFDVAFDSEFFYFNGYD